ncbi:hypothetical protein Tco_1085588 [Tanacetum coccineum]
MKLESLVIADQYAAVNMYPAPIHTARHTLGIGFARSIEPMITQDFCRPPVPQRLLVVLLAHTTVGSATGRGRRRPSQGTSRPTGNTGETLEGNPIGNLYSRKLYRQQRAQVDPGLTFNYFFHDERTASASIEVVEGPVSKGRASAPLSKIYDSVSESAEGDVVPTGKDNSIVSTGSTKVIPASRTILFLMTYPDQSYSTTFTTASSIPAASSNVIESVLHSFVAESDPQQQITYEDFDQIGKIDLEELDIK